MGDADGRLWVGEEKDWMREINVSGVGIKNYCRKMYENTLLYVNMGKGEVG